MLQPFFSFANENSNKTSWETFIIKRMKGEKTLLAMHEKLLDGSREENHFNLIANVVQKIVYLITTQQQLYSTLFSIAKCMMQIFQCLQMSSFNLINLTFLIKRVLILL